MFHKFLISYGNKNIKYNPKVMNQWGFLTQYQINKLDHKKEKGISDKLNEKYFFDKKEFKIGTKKGYNVIFDTYYKNQNFFDFCYTTPSISFALNQFRNYNIHYPPLLNFNSIDVKIINSWLEYGIAKSNHKIFGLWDNDYIQHQIIAGSIGPEAFHIWSQQPIKQKVKVLYKFDNRIDVWIWERCIMKENSPWIVYNINNFLI